VANAKWLQSRREAAWADGRERIDHLLYKYQQLYHLAVAPPPALVARELIRDILCVPLFFDPMPLDRYAEVQLVDGQPRVTVNSEIERMEGVKDSEGVANVAMLHEVMHIERDVSALVAPASMQLPGFEEPPAIICYRAPRDADRGGEIAEREFWAEEAGRAAAVSLPALRRTQPFNELIRTGRATTGAIKGAWPLLYESAAQIGVNISALVKQLTLESYISVVLRNGMADEIHVQPTLEGTKEWP